MNKELIEYKERVNKELEIFFNKKIEEAKKISNLSLNAVEVLKDYTLRGGNRIRAAMLYYGYACFKEPNEEIIKASMATELVQSYLLIHDDIIDQDVLRRGKDTVHFHYEKECKDNNPKHYGVSMAICVGDLVASYYCQIISKLNIDAGLKNKAIKKINEIVELVIHGQMLDLTSQNKKDLNEGEILNIYRLKTASYTVQGPLIIGAILAGANDEQLKKLSDSTLPLGLAFQIRDDINGMFGDEKVIGKPSDSDLKEGKKTLLMAKTLELAEEEDKKKVLNVLEKKEITKNEVEEVRKIIKKSGALDYVLKLAHGIIADSLKLIKNMELRDEGKNFVIEISDFMINREF